MGKQKRRFENIVPPHSSLFFEGTSTSTRAPLFHEELRRHSYLRLELPYAALRSPAQAQTSSKGQETDRTEEDRLSLEEDTAQCSLEDVEEEEWLEDEEEEEDEELDWEVEEEWPEATYSVDDEDLTGKEFEMQADTFDELYLPPSVVASVQQAFRMYVDSFPSIEVAAEALYTGIYDATPMIHHLFKTPRAIQAMRIMTGLKQLVTNLHDPPALKIAVETLAFGHLGRNSTIGMACIFRDAIIDLLWVELGRKFTTEAADGLMAVLNYAGGAIVYVKTFFADRIRLLDESWKLANVKGVINKEVVLSLNSQEGSGTPHRRSDKRRDTSSKRTSHRGALSSSALAGDPKGSSSSYSKIEERRRRSEAFVQKVPTTFKEMFEFNAAVLGLGNAVWMAEVLACFDNIVTNVTNSSRLAEECDVIVCRIATVSTGKVNLADFKSCMLASLRSLLPKDWTTQYEVAWTWLWESIERLLVKNLGMPVLWEKAYSKLLEGLDDRDAYALRQDILSAFFTAVPAGQDYFVQTDAFMHMIVQKALALSLDVFRFPRRILDDVSALGLRHTGYGIPPEYMPQFACACVDVVKGYTHDQVAIDACQWSITFLAKCLVRCIVEGSTIVMRAVSKNTKRSMREAVALAPRGERNGWMLVVQVGTQNISPLSWAIESGALEATSAMVGDLLTIRADRDKYYYGADDLFKRHFDIVRMLLHDAPAVLPELLDGLVWRSRMTVDAMRRVNYYIKHVLVDPEGKFAKTLLWVADANDPKLVCHPVIVLLADLVWSGLAYRSFLYRKLWFLFTLLCFVMSQSAIPHWRGHDEEKSYVERIMVVAFRVFVYICHLGPAVFSHAWKTCKAYRTNDTFVVRLWVLGSYSLPNHLQCAQEVISFLQMVFLMGMLATEPLLYCITAEPLFTELCTLAGDVRAFPYGVFSMLAMAFYHIMLIDLAVFNHRLSAFALVCGSMGREVKLALLALFMLVLVMSCAFSALETSNPLFKDIPHSAQALVDVLFVPINLEFCETMMEHPFIQAGVLIFMFISVFIFNMLAAQLTCAYKLIYEDVVGYARLKRIRTTVWSMEHVSDKQWEKFVTGLRLDDRIEFNAGDVGLSGGIQVRELAGVHPMTVDTVQRFGGSTDPSAPWPEDPHASSEASKFERLEHLFKRFTQRVAKSEVRALERRGSVRLSSAMFSSAMVSSRMERSISSSVSGSDQEVKSERSEAKDDEISDEE